MSKEKLLQMLSDAAPDFLSGEELAGKLGITRSAVWKYIDTLRRGGHDIQAVTNKGYRLANATDVLSKEGVQRYLQSDVFTLYLHESVGSTNDELRQLVHLPEGVVVAAKQQTKGSGRLGRTFHSPVDTGIYFSLLLKPQLAADKAVFITSMAAVAVCRAIEELTDNKTGIKWVNDIFIGGKKVCGILTQASFSLENSFAEYVILGIGINVYLPKSGFEKDIEKTAGAVSDVIVPELKNRLLATVLNKFWSLYTDFDTKNVAESYRAKSLVVGKDITLHTPTTTRSATALDIDDNCNLIVRLEDGSTETISYGEISIKVT